MPLRKNLKVFLILVSFLLFEACGQQGLSGEFSITNASGQDIPIGGVTILLIKEQSAVSYFSRFFGDKRATSELQDNDILKRFNAATLRTENLLSRLDDLDSKMDQVKTDLITAAFMDKDCGAIFERGGGYSIDRRDFFVSLIVSNPALATKRYVEEATQQLGELAAQQKEIIEDMKGAATTLKYYHAQVKGNLFSAVMRDQYEVVLLALEIDKLTKATDSEVVIYKAKTDKQGKFHISLPTEGIYWGFSLWEGMTSPLEKKAYIHLWAVKVDIPREKYVHFSNKNEGVSGFYKLVNKQLSN